MCLNAYVVWTHFVYNVNETQSRGEECDRAKANNSNKFHIFLVFIFNVPITIIFGSINVDVYNVSASEKERKKIIITVTTRESERQSINRNNNNNKARTRRKERFVKRKKNCSSKNKRVHAKRLCGRSFWWMCVIVCRAVDVLFLRYRTVKYNFVCTARSKIHTFLQKKSLFAPWLPPANVVRDSTKA